MAVKLSLSHDVRSWRNWQTHQLEGLAVAIPWWFESTRPHQIFLKQFAAFHFAQALEMKMGHKEKFAQPRGFFLVFLARIYFCLSRKLCSYLSKKSKPALLTPDRTPIWSPNSNN